MQEENKRRAMLSVAMYGTAIQRKSDGHVLTPEEVLSLTNELANELQEEIVEVAPGIYQTKADVEANMRFDEMRDNEL